MTRLTRLHVTAFRGIVDAALPFAGGSIVLGAGNGMGKTAFVDAIEFLYTGTVSTLAGTQGISLRHHGPHIKARDAVARVTADFDQPALNISRALSGGLIVPGPLKPYLERGAELSFILRRSQLQQFIHAKPADRYRSLAELLGADGLERTELALKRARDELERTIRGGEERLVDTEARLAPIPEDEYDEGQILAQANEMLAELGFAQYRLAQVGEVDKVRGAIVRQLSERQVDARQETRTHLATELQRGIGQDQLRDALTAYRALVPDGQAAGSRAQLLDLLQILRRGREYLKHTDEERCPLCQQDVVTRPLLSQLTRRVAELEQVSLQQQRLDRARDGLEAALQDTAGRLRAVGRLQSQAGLTGRVTPALDSAVSMLRESIRGGAPVESMEMAGRVDDALERFDRWSRETLAELNGKVTGGDDLRIQATNEALAVLQQVVTQRSQAERNRLERERLQAECRQVQQSLQPARRQLALAERAYTTFNQVKNDEIQRIFDELRDDLAGLYDMLHPGEGHSALSIEMDPRKRGSSELRMGFYGRHDEDPRAFGSEGHLDSLGLCIFLAFVRRFNGDWPLLVLDDVVPSIDAAHKQRVASLLFHEFGDRQLFITTHDARWFNDLRKAEQETGCDRTTQNLVIESWTLEEGPKLRPAQ